ncbi:hypothetical protein ACWD3Z_39765 [Streptomyces sp. NPDC002740]
MSGATSSTARRSCRPSAVRFGGATGASPAKYFVTVRRFSPVS